MKKVNIIIIIVFLFASSDVNGQTIFSRFVSPVNNTHYSSGTSGFCFGCSISHPEYAADTATANYANIKLPFSLFASAWIRLKLTGQGVANEKAGVVIARSGGLVSSSVLSTYSLRTYQNGNIQETVSGSSLTAQLLPGSSTIQTIHFDASKAFDEVRFLMSSALFYQNEVDVYYAYTDAVPLPIELLSYSAKLVSNDVIINWETASEINNSHFILEKSYDGYNFFEIDNVKGAGNSINVIKYSSIDKDITQTYNYYRLKQVDFDGTTTTFKTRVVKYNPPSPSATNTPIEVKVYPNPATEFVIVSSYTNYKDGIFKIYDIRGREKLSQNLDEMIDKRISVNELEKGMHIWRVVDVTGKLVDSGRLIIK